MSQFPLCSEFVPLLDSVKNQLAELKNLSQEFLRSGDDETKQKALLKGQELEKTKQQLVELKKGPVEFGGTTLVRIEKELLTFFENKLGDDLKYELNNEVVSKIIVLGSKKSATVLEECLKYLKLFDSLQLFNCSDTQIINLPELPDSLQRLECYNTKITVFLKLPDSLQVLYCHHTRITTLPDLPDSLRSLWCSSTKIAVLPELPDSIETLECYDTRIISLPRLPQGLLELQCHNTKITTILELPQSLRWFNCKNTPAARKPEVRERLRAFEQQHPSFSYGI